MTTTTTPLIDLPIKLFKTAVAWEKWLAAHGLAPGVWLQIAKKDAGVVSVSYAQALDGALCHGWIDGQKRGLDERYFLPRADRTGCGRRSTSRRPSS